MDTFNAISSIATAGALLAAIWQLRIGVRDGRARDDDRRVERALSLYESVVAEGATYEAFHRLSVLLRRVGSTEVGRTTWHVMSDADMMPGGCLDPADLDREQAFADMYAVLWFFERAKVALDRELVSAEVLMTTLGFHFWWWGQIMRDLKGPKSTQAIHELAVRAEIWAERSGRLEDWHLRCIEDFNGQSSRSRIDEHASGLLSDPRP